METKIRLAVATLALSMMTSIAFAEDHPYSEGSVTNVARIRTVDGKTDDYLKWLAREWKAQEEAAKKLGYIQSYSVALVEPRGPDDPDVLLFVTYKNWAALDGAIAQGDAVSKALNQTSVQSNEGQFNRSAIRRILGSYTIQTLNLK